MGRRSQTQTVMELLVQFVTNRTWKQAALIKHLGISPKTFRRCVRELADAGVPLERDDEPPHVYWSVPKSWFPGATVVKAEDVAVLLRLLGRVRRCRDRDRCVHLLMGRDAPPARDTADVEAAERAVKAIEDAYEKKLVLQMHYSTASRGETAWRFVSIQHVTHEPVLRFVAVCHRDGALKSFRGSYVLDARTEPDAAFRAAPPEDVARIVRESVDGYRGPGDVVRCTFRVRDPESRWVVDNLPPGPFQVRRAESGVRIEIDTAGLPPLARFVAGLGDAAVVETPELRKAVLAIAKGALRTASRPVLAKTRRRKTQPAGRERSGRSGR